ncbi:MAG TPA: DUF2335 domain-containing protein [Pyrinomonadaceae bacterium]
MSAVTFNSPIPPPNLLRQYNDIIPDGADRLFTMVEVQSTHRIELENIVIKGDDRRADRGLLTGFVIGILMLCLSFVLVMSGHDLAGTIFGTVDLLGLIGTFVYGRAIKMKELQKAQSRERRFTFP